jgi:hypothetical protein
LRRRLPEAGQEVLLVENQSDLMKGAHARFYRMQTARDTMRTSGAYKRFLRPLTGDQQASTPG